MAEVGFVVDKTDTTLFIDTGQKSYNQLTADKSTKRDLVLNFRKPRPGNGESTSIEPGNFQDAARSVIRDFLTAHPGSTKDRVYDAVISNLVQKGKMEAHDFDALLKSVAEEVQQPVKEDLFRNKEPDLWGSHVQNRWYLKETADQVDQAEQAKENAAAIRLAKFIGEDLKKNPEQEGVHYSDLFEQYLPVHDKPRRLLADWLPEFFIKTQSGTWRLPDKEEAQQLAELREAGTLRRIKRFANALIDGVPLREKDRPGSDVDLLDWLRQCRRAGLYEQGRAIYEKGGLNLANLDDEQQIEAEDDYRICVRRGSEEEAKPKRKSRKNAGRRINTDPSQWSRLGTALMLEQWVIDQLNPLKGEKLIILADPQRMIRAGAQAVDGWAKENGFTVLFCSGNLALREMYENLRNDPWPRSSWWTAPVRRPSCRSSTLTSKPAASRRHG